MVQSKPIKSEIALALYKSLEAGFRMKRRALQSTAATFLGREVSDTEFEAGMSELGDRVMRLRGVGGYICFA